MGSVIRHLNPSADRSADCARQNVDRRLLRSVRLNDPPNQNSASLDLPVGSCAFRKHVTLLRVVYWTFLSCPHCQTYSNCNFCVRFRTQKWSRQKWKGTNESPTRLDWICLGIRFNLWHWQCWVLTSLAFCVRTAHKACCNAKWLGMMLFSKGALLSSLCSGLSSLPLPLLSKLVPVDVNIFSSTNKLPHMASN